MAIHPVAYLEYRRFGGLTVGVSVGSLVSVGTSGLQDSGANLWSGHYCVLATAAVAIWHAGLMLGSAPGSAEILTITLAAVLTSATTGEGVASRTIEVTDRMEVLTESATEEYSVLVPEDLTTTRSPAATEGWIEEERREKKKQC